MSATIKFVGYGANGTAAYVVLDEGGNYINNERGQFLLSIDQATALAAAHNDKDGTNS